MLNTDFFRSIFVSLGLLFNSIFDQVPAKYHMAQHQRSLLWSDEFDQHVDGQLNKTTSEWDPQIGDKYGNSALYYTAENAFIENSKLLIESRKEWVDSQNSTLYTSARLMSKRSFKYGYFEMRAILPKV